MYGFPDLSNTRDEYSLRARLHDDLQAPGRRRGIANRVFEAPTEVVRVIADVRVAGGFDSNRVVLANREGTSRLHSSAGAGVLARSSAASSVAVSWVSEVLERTVETMATLKGLPGTRGETRHMPLNRAQEA